MVNKSNLRRRREVALAAKLLPSVVDHTTLLEFRTPEAAMRYSLARWMITEEELPKKTLNCGVLLLCWPIIPQLRGHVQLRI